MIDGQIRPTNIFHRIAESLDVGHTIRTPQELRDDLESLLHTINHRNGDLAGTGIRSYVSDEDNIVSHNKITSTDLDEIKTAADNILKSLRKFNIKCMKTEQECIKITDMNTVPRRSITTRSLQFALRILRPQT